MSLDNSRARSLKTTSDINHFNDLIENDQEDQVIAQLKGQLCSTAQNFIVKPLD